MASAPSFDTIKPVRTGGGFEAVDTSNSKVSDEDKKALEKASGISSGGVRYDLDTYPMIDHKYSQKVSDNFIGDSEPISSDKFYNLENPKNPYIEIDIKTGETKSEETLIEKWISLIPKQNDFFKSLNIEDDGGVKKFTLTLFDRDFVNLESLISTTVAFSQLKSTENAAENETSVALTVSDPNKVKDITDLDNNEKAELLLIKTNFCDKYLGTGGIRAASLEEQNANKIKKDKATTALIDIKNNRRSNNSGSIIGPADLGYLFDIGRFFNESALKTTEINTKKTAEILDQISDIDKMLNYLTDLATEYKTKAIDPNSTEYSNLINNYYDRFGQNTNYFNNKTKKIKNILCLNVEIINKLLIQKIIYPEGDKVKGQDYNFNSKTLIGFKKNFLKYLYLYRNGEEERGEVVGYFDRTIYQKQPEYRELSSQDGVDIGLYSQDNVIDILKTNLDLFFKDLESLNRELLIIQKEYTKLRGTREGDKQLINTKESKVPLVYNLRIRFGHSDYNTLSRKTGTDNEMDFKYGEWNDYNKENEKYTIEGDKKYYRSGYLARTSYSFPIIRSPWIYFLITGVRSKISGGVLSYTLTGFSVSAIRLNNFKMIQKFAKLKGTPSKMLTDLMLTFNQNLEGSTVRLWVEKDVDEIIEEKIIDENGVESTAEIELNLGSESCIGKTNMYKSLSSLFSEFCSACPPYKTKTEKIEYLSNDGQGNMVPTELETAGETYPLSYKVEEDKEGFTNVIFYYKKPKKYKFIRTYDWGMYRNTIVKDLEINNKNEFAALSSFSIFDKNTNKLNTKDITNYGIGEKLTSDMSSGNSLFLVNSVSEISNYSNANRLNNAIVDGLKNSLYEGTLTISGDPFYLFDEAVTAYSYPIRINVWRPTTIGKEGDDVSTRKDSQGKAALSYMSGYYVITSITHSIDTSGYITTLGVMSYPGIEDCVFPNKAAARKKALKDKQDLEKAKQDLEKAKQDLEKAKSTSK